MNKERKRQLKKENTQKDFIEIEGRKLDKMAEELFKKLSITETSTPEEILKNLEKVFK